MAGMDSLLRVSVVRLVLLAALIFSASPTDAATSFMKDHEGSCVMGIALVVGDYTFQGSHGGYYKRLCSSKLAALSLYATVQTYCTERELEHGLETIGEYCTEYGGVELLPESMFAANLTPSALATLPIYEMDDITTKQTLTTAFIMERHWFELAYKSQDSTYRESHYEALYGFGTYGYWGAVLVYGMIQNAVRRFLEHRRGYVYADAEGISRAKPKTPAALRPFVTVYALARKHVVMPSLLPPYHQRRYLGCTVPTRAESLVVYGFWIYSIILCSVHIEAVANNVNYGSIPPQVLRHIADRSGTLSYFCLPLLWMFSGRNNVFMWLTGWNFGTFNIFHRHIARIATLEAIVHSFGWTFYFPAYSSWSRYYYQWHRLYYQMGAAATIVMSLLILLSFSYFRRKLYESFLLVHIIFSILLLVFLYYHTNIYAIEEFNYPFLMPPIGIWVIDRLLRIVRQLYCNIYVGRYRGKTVQGTKTSVSFDQDSDMLVVDVMPGQQKLFAGPGQHYYLYQPFRLFGWENHPFTLASWRHDEASDINGGDNGNSSGGNGNSSGSLHLRFFIRPYDGWTKKLKTQCLARGTEDSQHTISTTLFIEGPYGKSEPLHAFDHVLLIAGGSGMAAVLPYLLDHMRRAADGAVGMAAGKNRDGSRRVSTRTRCITLVWAERRAAYIQSLVHGELAPFLKRQDVQASFYLTGAVNSASLPLSTSGSSTFTSSAEHVVNMAPSSPSTDEKHSHELGEKDDVDVAPARKPDVAHPVFLQGGRPQIASIVQKAAATIYGSDDRLAVMVCGPASLSDDVRYVTMQAMETKRDSIEFFEETFGW